MNTPDCRLVIGPFSVPPKHMPNEGYAVVGADHVLTDVGACIAICPDERYAAILAKMLNERGSEYGIAFKSVPGAV